MILRILGLALIAAAVALAHGVVVPLAVVAVMVMVTGGLLERLGHHTQRSHRARWSELDGGKR